jgi:DNA primase
MSSQIEEIKNRLDIVDVISGYMKLQKAGINYKAPCPFHGEKTPSFFVSPVRQIWHCFGCGKGGDIFKFVMEIESSDFKEALQTLAQKAGVVLKYEDTKEQGEKKRLYDIIDSSVKFFQESLLKTDEGKQALDYLLKRGLLASTIEDFRVGWAPVSWNALVKNLKSIGYSDKDMIAAGIAIEGKKTDMRTGSKCYDRFRSRIMFPIFDQNGRPVGFSGRIFKPEGVELPGATHDIEEAKYVNTPQTAIYDKSRVLYGLDKAKTEIRRVGFGILVEGQMDLIMSHQADAKNTVAVSGTALTPFHLKMLKHYADTLYTSFDMDAAGDSATKRGIDLALAEGFDVRVIVLPSGKDPADFIKENPSGWQDILAKNMRIMEFYFESAFSRHDKSSLDGKKKIAQELLFQIKKVQNEIEKSHWIEELAARLKIKEHFLMEELKKIKVDFENLVSPKVSDKMFETPAIDREKAIFERLLGTALGHPEMFPEIRECINDLEEEMFEDDLILSDILSHLKKQEGFTADDFKKGAPSHTHGFIDSAVFKFECLESEFSKKEQILAELRFLLKELRTMFLKKEMEKLKFRIQRAEQAGNSKEVDELSVKFGKLSLDLAKTMRIMQTR